MQQQGLQDNLPKLDDHAALKQGMTLRNGKIINSNVHNEDYGFVMDDSRESEGILELDNDNV